MSTPVDVLAGHSSAWWSPAETDCLVCDCGWRSDPTQRAWQAEAALAEHRVQALTDAGYTIVRMPEAVRTDVDMPKAEGTTAP